MDETAIKQSIGLTFCSIPKRQMSLCGRKANDKLRSRLKEAQDTEGYLLAWLINPDKTIVLLSSFSFPLLPLGFFSPFSKNNPFKSSRVQFWAFELPDKH